jgi:predicted small integral membrane protein
VEAQTYTVTGLGWMAWTWQTAIFWVFIAAALTAMGVWEWRRPGGAPRKGVLRIVTTRGDRLFVSLLSAAYVHLGWLAATDVTLWGATAASVVLMVLVFRYV